jgi:hypothetical protein
MKFAEILYYVIGFNAVMLVLQGTGIFNTGYSFENYAGTFVIGSIIGLIGGLSGAALSTFFVPNAATERSFMYATLAPIMIGFFATAFVPFDAICSPYPVAVGFLGVIKILIALVCLFWLFQLVFGGGEMYQ